MVKTWRLARDHLLAGVVVFFIVAPVTQQWWRPFDVVHGVEAALQGDELIITWDLETRARYPVTFRSRVVHTSTGTVRDIREFGSSTGKIGRFKLRQVTNIGEPLLAGEWCYIVDGFVQYNIANTTARVYPPVCVTI